MADCRLRWIDSTSDCDWRLLFESVFHFSTRRWLRFVNAVWLACCNWLRRSFASPADTGAEPCTGACGWAYALPTAKSSTQTPWWNLPIILRIGFSIRVSRASEKQRANAGARANILHPQHVWFDYPCRVGENHHRPSTQWACGAAGSALPWHGRGRRFDPDQVHQFSQQLRPGECLQVGRLCRDLCHSPPFCYLLQGFPSHSAWLPSERDCNVPACDGSHPAVATMVEGHVPLSASCVIAQCRRSCNLEARQAGFLRESAPCGPPAVRELGRVEWFVW